LPDFFKCISVPVVLSKPRQRTMKNQSISQPLDIFRFCSLSLSVSRQRDAVGFCLIFSSAISVPVVLSKPRQRTMKNQSISQPLDIFRFCSLSLSLSVVGRSRRQRDAVGFCLIFSSAIIVPVVLSKPRRRTMKNQSISQPLDIFRFCSLSLSL